MSDNRRVASDILAIAHQTVIKDRPGVHGSAENSFKMIADMWSVTVQHAVFVRTGQWVPVGLLPVDVAHMMAQMKQARAMYGDANNPDNFIDGAGYTALAGMLQLPDPDFSAYAAKGSQKVDPTKPPPAAKLKGETPEEMAERCVREAAEELDQ